MLPKGLEELLVATYLKQGTDALEARAKDRPMREDGSWSSEGNALNEALGTGFEALGGAVGLSREKRAEFTQEAAHASKR